MTRLSTPESWHRKQHNWGRDAGVPMRDCWRCQRNQAICKSKRSYPDARAAGDAAHGQNIREKWARPVYPYPCRYCPAYHLATAIQRRKVKRVEKQRRKWLRERYAEIS